MFALYSPSFFLTLFIFIYFLSLYLPVLPSLSFSLSFLSLSLSRFPSLSLPSPLYLNPSLFLFLSLVLYPISSFYQAFHKLLNNSFEQFILALDEVKLDSSVQPNDEMLLMHPNSAIRITAINVPSTARYILMQAHSHFHNVTLSYDINPVEDRFVTGRNLGLLVENRETNNTKPLFLKYEANGNNSISILIFSHIISYKGKRLCFFAILHCLLVLLMGRSVFLISLLKKKKISINLD